MLNGIKVNNVNFKRSKPIFSRAYIDNDMNIKHEWKSLESER